MNDYKVPVELRTKKDKHYTILKESDGYDRRAQIKYIFDNVRKDTSNHFHYNCYDLRLKISPHAEHTDGSPAPKMDNKFAGCYVKNGNYIVINPNPEIAMKAYNCTMPVEEFLYTIIAHEVAHYLETKPDAYHEFIRAMLRYAKDNNFTTGYLEKENYKAKGEDKYNSELFAEYFATMLYKMSHEPLNFYHLVPNDVDLSINGLITPGWAYKHNDIELFRKMTDKYRERICYQWKIFPNKTPKELTDEDIIYAINTFRQSKYGVNTLYLFRYPPFEYLGPRMRECLKGKRIVEVNIESDIVKNQIYTIDWGRIGSHSNGKPLDKMYYRCVSKEKYFEDYDDNAKMIFANINHIGIILKNGQLTPNSFKVLS